MLKKITLFLLLISSSQQLFAQCTGGTLAGSLTPTGSWQSATVDGGTYYTFTATAGITYNFSFCSADGGATLFDTQISILDNSGITVSGNYNDDFCSTASRVDFVCPSTNTYRLLVNKYNCTTQSGLGTLRYRIFTPALCPLGLGTGVTNVASLPYSVSGVSTNSQVNDCNNSTMSYCGQTSDDYGHDRVYVFTPITAGNFTVTLTSASSNISLAVYEGCPLKGNVSTCVGYSYGTGNRSVNGCAFLGKTYYVVVDRRSNTGFTFGLSISAPVATSCSVGTVVAILSLPYSSIGRSTCGALNDVTSANAESCGASGYYASEDEVFSFVPATSGKVQVLLSSSAYNTAVFLVEGCPLAAYCDVANSLGSTCIASSYGITGNKVLCGDVIAGRTYYVIADASSGCFSYNLSISAPSTFFQGATCASPIIIPSLPYQATGENTACMGNDYSKANVASCGTLYESGEDRVYRYTSTGPECISITLSGASTNNIGFQVYNGCPDVVGTTCIASGGGGFSGSLSASVNLPTAGTYYIIVDTYAAPSNAEFNLLIDTYGGNQDNDQPCGAFELPLGVTVIGDVNCSNGSGEPAVPSCWTTPNTLNTVWFYFTAPASGNVTLRTSPGSLLNTQIGVYSGTCGTGLTSIGCNDNAAACATTNTRMSQLALTGLNPGEVYYVVVDGYTTSTGTFGLLAINSNDALPTIFGQECNVPLPICNDTVPVGDPGFQSFGNYCDFTGVLPNCLASGERGSVWYEIPINANGDLEFNIIPNDWLGAPSTTCTDYDFAVYKIQGTGAVNCASIFTGAGPIRCDYSALGVTGCYGATDGIAPPAYPGFGDSYVSKLPVLIGEKYVLVLSNFSNSLSGFTMIFSTTSPVNYLTSPDTVYWTGSADSDWFKSANWGGCAIPSCTRSAVILASSANQPAISAMGAAVKSINIEAGAKLTINSNRSLSVCGNFSNDGSLNARPNSTIVINGTTNQTIGGNLVNSSTLNHLTISKTSGLVILNNDLDIAGNFTFTTASSSFNASDKMIRLNGSFTNSIGGTFSQSLNGILEFTGTGTQTYNNIGNLENVYMFNSGSGVSLASDMNISTTGSLTLSSGKIVTSSYEVDVLNDASSAVNSGSTTSFVQGYLRRALPSTTGQPRIFDFPVGHATAGFERMNIATYNGNDPGITSLRVHFSLWPTPTPPAGLGADPSCPITYNANALDNGLWTILPLGSGNADMTMTLYNRTYNNASSAFTIMQELGGSWTIPTMTQGACGAPPVIAVMRPGISQTFTAGVPLGFGTAQGSSALPVTLLSFSAEAHENNIECNWTTASEVNNRGFEVQRATDPDHFETIGWVDGNGTTNLLKNYKFIDENVIPNKIYYYRLRQIDYDGQFTITRIIACIIKSSGAVLVEAYPNPYRESTTIRYMLTRPSMITIEVMDATGKMVKRYQQGLQDAGQYTMPFSGKNNGLSSGTYMVTVWADDQRYQLRLTEND